MPPDRAKCDGAADDSIHEFYIELKGHKVAHAVEQLESTLRELSGDVGHAPKKCFVVGTSIPLVKPARQVFQTNFSRKYNATLRFASQRDEETVAPA